MATDDGSDTTAAPIGHRPSLSGQRAGPDDGAVPEPIWFSMPQGAALFRSEVGRRVRALRTWEALSQEEIAERAGVSRNFVSAIERGAQGLDAWRLWRLATVLGVRLGVLLCQEPLQMPSPAPGP